MNIPIDISNVVLNTKRLTLRPWKESDVDDFFEYASIDGVGQMAGWAPHKDKQESLKIINMFIDKKKTFAIEYGGKVIGSLGIEKYNEESCPELQNYRARELGFVVSKDYWGQGIAPEATKRVIQYLFEELDVQIILCGYYTFNSQSKRVQEKCGFEFYKKELHKNQMGETQEAFLNIMINPKYKDVIKL